MGYYPSSKGDIFKSSLFLKKGFNDEVALFCAKSIKTAYQDETKLQNFLKLNGFKLYSYNFQDDSDKDTNSSVKIHLSLNSGSAVVIFDKVDTDDLQSLAEKFLYTKIDNQSVLEYIKDRKIIICGYANAGVAATDFALNLIDRYDADKNEISVYTFALPAEYEKSFTDINLYDIKSKDTEIDDSIDDYVKEIKDDIADKDRYLYLSSGWELRSLGGYDCDAEVFLKVSGATILWQYDHGWRYDSDVENSAKYDKFDTIKRGFWVKSKENKVVDIEKICTKKEDIKNLSYGWNLAGNISAYYGDIFQKTQGDIYWLYDDGWYLLGRNFEDFYGYPKISVVDKKDGLWIYIKKHTLFAPFVDMSEWPPFDFNQTKDVVENYVFSFINSSGKCLARWGHYDEYTLDYFKDKIDSVKKSSEEDIISFGGASATYNGVDYTLAHNCQDALSLKNAYKKVVDTYGIKWLDFDIEGKNAANNEEIDRRFEALKLLQEEYPDLKISLTLGVMPYGFDDTQKNIIKESLKYGVRLYSINLMLMDYSEDLSANDPQKTQMYDYSISAIESVNEYLKTVLKGYPTINGDYFYMLGAIAMIGQNDISDEIWYKNDFIRLEDYAIKNSLRLLSFWAIHRDNPKTEDSNINNSTMLLKEIYGSEDFAFSKIGDLLKYQVTSLKEGLSWYWQLDGDLNTSVKSQIYDIDLFDTPKETINKLKKESKTVVCYFDAGTYESWRSDADEFNDSAIGKKLEDWDERWLDIRDESVKKVMLERLDLAKSKGCQAVEPDNIDGYTNDTGFDLSYEDQLHYNIFLSKEAKKRGLKIALKNDIDQIVDLGGYFDFAINEQCHKYNECDKLMPFIYQGKAVLNAEYDTKYLDGDNFKKLCEDSKKRGFSTIVLPVSLDGSFVKSCDY